MSQGEHSRTGLGAASLIMILLVLCLALMGVLSLMSARADRRLSERYAELSEGYAQAAVRAQYALADLDAQLARALAAAADAEQYEAACLLIEAADGAEVEWLDDMRARMQFDAGEERVIEVIVRCSPWTDARNRRMQIESHTLVDMEEWEQTESLILMDME